MNFIINAAMIPCAGTFKYKELSGMEFERTTQEFYRSGLKSMIGYPDTVAMIEAMTGCNVGLNRGKFEMMIGDQAIVIKLKYRVPDPKQKGRFTPEKSDFEFGLLERIA